MIPTLENPIGYLIIAGLLIFVSFVLYITRNKRNLITTPTADTNETKIITTDDLKSKKFGIRKVLRNHFSNGSCLIIMNDGRLIRRKAKYCC